METPQIPRSESEHERLGKRLEYRPPILGRLGKLANVTLMVLKTGNADGGPGGSNKSAP